MKGKGLSVGYKILYWTSCDSNTNVTASTFSLVQTQQTRKSCGNCFVLDKIRTKKLKLIFSVVFPTKDLHERKIFYIFLPEGISNDRTETCPTCLLMLLIRFSVLFNWRYFVPLLMFLISISSISQFSHL